MENRKNAFFGPGSKPEFQEYDDYDDSMVDTFEYDDYGEFDDDDQTEYDDFDDAVEFDDDDSEFDDYDDREDAEFLGAIAGLAAPLIGKGLGAAIKGVSGLLRKSPKRSPLRSRSYVSGGPSVAGRIATNMRSNLSGLIRTATGRSVRFKLPPNVATKNDIVALKRGIATNARAIHQNTKGVKANAKSVLATAGRLTSIDKKHTAASNTQNRVLTTLNKRVNIVKKEIDAAEERQRMLQMFQFMIPPEIEKMTFKTTPSGGTEVEVSDVEFKTNLLPMMMAMGGGGMGGGDFMNNPMMMFVMMEAFKDKD